MSEIRELLNQCMSCKTKPCQKGCPLLNDTTGFIKLMKEEKYKEAYELLCNTSVLQSVCGRVCPHSKQCEGSCIKNNIKNSSIVSIGKLETYIGDLAIKNNWKIPKFTNEKLNKKVAVIGAGPCGLTCSAFLARNGFDVTIYEKYSSLGGIINHSIPEFRLDKKVLENTINKILELGINVEYNKELGKDFNLNDIENEYDAIFLSFGRNISLNMNIEGANKEQVLGANELLEYKNYPDFNNKKVAIIGGGNVALDVARTIKRLNAKNVTIIYRRSKQEMPSEDIEIEYAEKEGVEFLFQTNLLIILGNNKVERIECIKTQLIKKENENRRYPVNIENSNFILDVDYVIMAIGSTIDKELIERIDVDKDENDKIIVDENYCTSNEKIFISNEIINPKGTIAWAARSGREAAEKIKKYILKK